MNWYQRIVKWLFSNIVLPCIKEQIPPQPNYQNSEEVRVFFDRILSNEMLVWVVMTTSNKVDDEVIAFAKTLTENPHLWNSGWDVIGDFVKPVVKAIRGKTDNANEETANDSIGVLEVTALAGLLAQVVKAVKHRKAGEESKLPDQNLAI